MASKVKDAVVWYQKKVRPACLSLIIAPGETVAICCCSFISGSNTCKPRNCSFRLSWGRENESFVCSAHHFYLFKVMSGHRSEASTVLGVHLFRCSDIGSAAGRSSSPPPPLYLSAYGFWTQPPWFGGLLQISVKTGSSWWISILFLNINNRNWVGFISRCVVLCLSGTLAVEHACQTSPWGLFYHLMLVHVHVISWISNLCSVLSAEHLRT